MSVRKMNRAFSIAGIPDMRLVREHIERNLRRAAPEAVLESMTSKQLAAVIKAAHQSFHDGRASVGDVEIIDRDALWVGHGVNRIVALSSLRAPQDVGA